MIAFIAQLSAWSAYRSSSSNIAAGVRLASMTLLKTENTVIINVIKIQSTLITDIWNIQYHRIRRRGLFPIH